ncbi:MAG: hypothetical protein JRJ46_06880 [Deltaproteobacteria bacterium]|nr:hypothetical protein [Deltaproteobacteria bacterium]
MEAVIKGLVVLIANLNLKFLSLEIFNSEGRSHEFHMKKLELALIQYIGLRGHNPVVAIYGLVSEIRFTYLQH